MEQLAWKTSVYEVVDFILYCICAVEICERNQQGCNEQEETNPEVGVELKLEDV